MEVVLPATTTTPTATTMMDEQTSRDPEDVILLTVIRCIGLFYGYYQIRLICTLSSKYTLAITSIFPLLGSLIFSSQNHLLPEEFNQIPETLLYFLLIMDLPRACFLTSIALQRSDCCKEGACSSSIFQGVRILAPWLTMDTVIECIVLLLGYYSGIRRLEALCTFVCLSVLVNYLTLLVVFPIALRIIHEILGTSSDNYSVDQDSPSSTSGNPSAVSCLKLDHLLRNWSKMIGTQGMSIVCRSESLLPTEVCQLIQPSSFWLRGKILSGVVLALAYVFGWISISVDQLVVLSVAAALTIRYLFFEEKADNFRSVSEESTVTTTTTTVNTVYLDSGINVPQITPTAHRLPSNFAVSGNLAIASSAPAPIAIAPPPVVSSPRAPTTTTATRPNAQRVRKMPVMNMNLNPNELTANLMKTKNEIEQERNERAIKTPSTVKSQREGSMSPDSGQDSDKNRSGSLSPITFCIGDHSSDEEGDEPETPQQLETVEDMQNINMENMKLEREEDENSARWTGPPRPLDELKRIYNDGADEGIKELSDEEVIKLVEAKVIPGHQLEKGVQDSTRGVVIRRKISCMREDVRGPGEDIPFQNYDYHMVQGACCENVIGYIPVPIGIAGPLLLDGKQHLIPMATTEGCLVASTNRGCRALVNGVQSRVTKDGMTRAPVVRFPTACRAADASVWLTKEENFKELKQSFDSTSRYARLKKVLPKIAGRELYIRFEAETGDAMGMNMISKGTEVALGAMQNVFPDMEILALSGNVCTDKKPAAMNWLEGRGKSVVAEAIVPAHIVETVLKTTTAHLVELNIAKNLIGSACAGSIGGYNAHAANIVTAIYIACGQDPAQNVCSSNCMTLMEPTGPDNRDLWISCTMPSIECGTVGGGTILPPQAGCLEMLGVRGANHENPGENARTFARIVAGAVVAGELSLMAALAAGHLVKSHLKHNRSATLLSAVPLQQLMAHSDTENSRYSGSLSPASIPTYPTLRNGNLCDSSSSDNSDMKPVRVNNTSSNNVSQGHNLLVHRQEDMVKSNINNSKSSPEIQHMDFLSVPECKQT